ncbi:MAG TPA: hypothetical protein VII07_18775 [Bradyrhizobium sp.]
MLPSLLPFRLEVIDMAELQKLITGSPSTGFRWEIRGGGRTLKSGTTKTEAEANTAADAAVKELAAKDEGR